MATLKVTAGDFSLFSRRSGYTWSDGTYDIEFKFDDLPDYASIDKAVLTFKAGDPICGSTLFHVDGKYPGVNGPKSVEITVDARAEKKKVHFYFRGSGREKTQSSLTISEVVLTLTYHIAAVPIIYHAEDGKLVEYGLYHAEGEELVPYSLYRAVGDKLVKY